MTAHDLAVMAATLANGGVNPMTGERVIVAGVCRRVLAVMATAGLYELSGDWLYEIGMPGKSGVSGGIVTVSPGKGGLATFSPPLDAAETACAANSSRSTRRAARAQPLRLRTSGNLSRCCSDPGDAIGLGPGVHRAPQLLRSILSSPGCAMLKARGLFLIKTTYPATVR